MAIFKCKMCGGDLDVREGMTVCECEFCGTTQTLPTADDERKTNLFNRATQLRRASEFDRAIAVYERLISEFPNEAEAYWGLVLCKYGIEYVDDPLTYRKIPTCHRTSYDSIFDDINYIQAVENADTVARALYKKEAETINDIQKGILRIVKNEKPFDIFICYKETDDSGNRTQDSVLAQDLYYQLVNEGFKVFFSRITLEGKLGAQYEPYIFAALNSAKVMVVVGTKPEYYNAVWLRNEWGRFLALMKKDKNKIIIPAYRDMDPYDLPDALSMFQAQDMSKLGFMQDLVRGIKKVVGKDDERPAVQPVVQPVIQQSSSANIENLLKRGMLALEDGKWDDADKFFEDVLNENVEEARAYFGKLMIDLKFRTEKDFETNEKEFLPNENFNRIKRFGDEALINKVLNYNKQAAYNRAVRLLNEAKDNEGFLAAKNAFISAGDFMDAPVQAEKCDEAAKEFAYLSAVELMRQAEKDSVQPHKYSWVSQTYLSAAKGFEKLADHKDSPEKAKECVDLAETYRKKDIYHKAESACAVKNTAGYEKAIGIFNSIKGFEDVNQRIEECKDELQKLTDEINRKIEEEAAEAKREEAKTRMRAILIVIVIVVLIGILPKLPKAIFFSAIEGQYSDGSHTMTVTTKGSEIKVDSNNGDHATFKYSPFQSAYTDYGITYIFGDSSVTVKKANGQATGVYVKE